jgi:bifunctional NMN adenylyltransferase/nudix hydrolase
MNTKLELTNYEILYPITYPTIDVAVVDSEDDKVLLGKKKNRDYYCFIGGFVDPTDESLECACMRELFEEVRGMYVSNDYYYISSRRINDSRYPKRDETITTSFFATEYISGSPLPNEHEGIVEFDDVKFFDIKESNIQYLSENHKALFRDLIEWYKEQKHF